MLSGDFFLPVAISVFGEALGKLGARKSKSTPYSVRFETSDWFVDLFAIPKDGPPYCPHVEVGPLPPLGQHDYQNQVDIVTMLPKDSDLSDYNLRWRYFDPEEMKAAFSKIRDEVFIPYVIPFLRDQQELTEFVKAAANEVYEQWQEEVATHNSDIYHARAETAFKSKKFREFLNQMKKIPIDRRTKIDLARIKYAKKNQELR